MPNGLGEGFTQRREGRNEYLRSLRTASQETETPGADLAGLWRRVLRDSNSGCGYLGDGCEVLGGGDFGRGGRGVETVWRPLDY